MLRWLTQRGIVGEYVQEFKELMLQILDMIEKKTLLGKKSLSIPSLRKKGVCEGNHEEDDNDSGNGNDCGNGKPRLGKKKPNKKRGKLKCFLCNSLHLLKKYLKKSTLSDKENLLQKCMKKSTIEKDDVLDNEPKKLGLSKRKVETKRVKRSKKKRVKASTRGKCEFVIKLIENVAIKTVKLGLMKLNSSKTMELTELSTRLLPMEEMSFALDLEEEGTMQTLKLGLMRLTSVDTSNELPSMREVGYASKFRKMMMQVGQLT
ncbi:hypothetical protein Goari_012080 [Gossypium aridum]|uniref:Uncharacterized protein n=1 Tax=Gossypium aridum TaxID=34290 RepID=A0A7J8WZD6_GOSAI|nr:hypothetical protein [Gossypium aridum]